MLQCKWNTRWLNTIQCSLKISQWQHLIPVKASKIEVRKTSRVLSFIGFMCHCLWLCHPIFPLKIPFIGTDELWFAFNSYANNSCRPLPLGSAVWHKWQSRSTFSGCFSYFLNWRVHCLACFLQCVTVILGPLLLSLKETGTRIWYGFIIISSLHFL